MDKLDTCIVIHIYGIVIAFKKCYNSCMTPAEREVFYWVARKFQESKWSVFTLEEVLNLLQEVKNEYVKNDNNVQEGGSTKDLG